MKCLIVWSVHRVLGRQGKTSCKYTCMPNEYLSLLCTSHACMCVSMIWLGMCKVCHLKTEIVTLFTGRSSFSKPIVSLLLCSVTPKLIPPKIGRARPILAEKLVPQDHFCCQNLSGQTDFGSQNWSPFAKISPPTKVSFS